MAKKLKKKDIDVFMKVLDALQYPEERERIFKKTGFSVRIEAEDDSCNEELEKAISKLEESWMADESKETAERCECDAEAVESFNIHEINDEYEFSERQRIFDESYEASEKFREEVIIPKIEKYLTEFMKGSILFDVDTSFLATCNDARIRGYFEPSAFAVHVEKKRDYWYFIPLDNVCNYEGALFVGYKMPTAYFVDDNDMDQMIISVANKLHLDVCIVPDQNLMIFSYDIDM